MDKINPSTITLIQNDYTQCLKPKLAELADCFYRTLFNQFPESKKLFKTTNMERQKEGFIKGISFIAEHVDDPKALAPYLTDMGIRHSSYGIYSSHYGWVGQALLEALRACHSSQDWTPELAKTWEGAFTLISEIMKEGADSVRMKKDVKT